METRHGRKLSLEEITKVMTNTPQPKVASLTSWFEPHYESITAALTFHKPTVTLEGIKFNLKKMDKCNSIAFCGGEYLLSPVEGFTPMTRFCANRIQTVMNNEESS